MIIAGVDRKAKSAVNMSHLNTHTQGLCSVFSFTLGKVIIMETVSWVIN